MKRTIGSKFRSRYGKPPKNRTLANFYAILFDAYVTGYICGYDESNKMWKKKGRKK